MVVTAKPLPIVGGTFNFGLINEIKSRGLLAVLEDAWQEHGDIFMLQLATRKMIFALHPEHVKTFNLTRRDNYVKAGTYDAPRKYMFGNSILVAEGDHWLRQRRFLAPFFTPRGIQSFLQTMVDDTAHMVEEWAAYAQRGEPVDIEMEMNRLAASIILHSMFSTDNPAQMNEIKRSLETMIAFLSYKRAQPIDLPTWMPTAANREYVAARDLVHGYIDQLIAERQQMPEDEYPDDLLSKMLLTRDEETGERMSIQQVHDEAVTIFAAGHETTARTMMFAWYALSQNPAVRDQLHAELDTTIAGDVPTLEELKQLGYTLRTIKETLRLYPAAPMYVRDAVADDVVDGYRIPAGVGVTMSPYFTHRHPDFWEAPEQFDPMRFAPEREQAQHSYQFHPFAAGQRICIGNNFSLLESQVILAILAKHFSLAPVPDYNFKIKMAGTLGVYHGMPMHITRR